MPNHWPRLLVHASQVTQRGSIVLARPSVGYRVRSGGGWALLPDQRPVTANAGRAGVPILLVIRVRGIPDRAA